MIEGEWSVCERGGEKSTGQAFTESQAADEHADKQEIMMLVYRKIHGAKGGKVKNNMACFFGGDTLRQHTLHAHCLCVCSCLHTVHMLPREWVTIRLTDLS